MCWTICDWTGRKILTASAFRISVDYSLKYLALLGNLRFVFNVQIYRTKWIIWLAYSSNFYVIPIKNNVVFRIVNIFPLHVLHRALLWKIQFCKSCIPFKEKEQSCSSIFLHSVNGLLKQLEQTRYSRYKPKKPIRNEALGSRISHSTNWPMSLFENALDDHDRLRWFTIQRARRFVRRLRRKTSSCRKLTEIAALVRGNLRTASVLDEKNGPFNYRQTYSHLNSSNLIIAIVKSLLPCAPCSRFIRETGFFVSVESIELASRYTKQLLETSFLLRVSCFLMQLFLPYECFLVCAIDNSRMSH